MFSVFTGKPVQTGLFQFQRIMGSRFLIKIMAWCRSPSDVNACLPPLQWQTYDVDFINAVVRDGSKVRNTRLTIRLNGIVIHDNIEIDSKCPGSRSGPEGSPGPIRLQGHDHPLQFRNIWIVEK